MPKKITPMLPCEIARLYGVTIRTLNNWLRRFREGDVLKRVNTRYYTIKQVRYIFKCLGEPEGFE